MIIDPGDFHVESYEDYQLVIKELALAEEEETKRIGQRVMAVFRTLNKPEN